MSNEIILASTLADLIVHCKYKEAGFLEEGRYYIKIHKVLYFKLLQVDSCLTPFHLFRSWSCHSMILRFAICKIGLMTLVLPSPSGMCWKECVL